MISANLSISHIAVHHDPEGRCLPLLEKNAVKLSKLFSSAFVVVSKETLNIDGTKKLLEQAGMTVVVRPEKFQDLDQAANFALREVAPVSNADTYFFGCFDRTLHWIDMFPEELSTIVDKGTQGYDFLVVGRTKRAFDSHPLEQRDPEAYINKEIGKLLRKQSLDVTAACRIMTKEAAKTIGSIVTETFPFSKDGVVITDYLWPLVAFRLQLTVGEIEVEGLEFETPDQYSDEIASLGYDGWLRKYFTEAHKKRRWQQAYEVDKIEEYLSTLEEM